MPLLLGILACLVGSVLSSIPWIPIFGSHPPLSPACNATVQMFGNMPRNMQNNTININVLQMVASSGISEGSKGDYYQCILNYQSQYCLVTSPTTFLADYLRHANTTTGLCLPSNCNAEDVRILASVYFAVAYSHLVPANEIGAVECISPNHLHGAGAIFTVTLLSVFATLVVIGTLRAYLLNRRHMKKELHARGINDGDDDPLLNPDKPNVEPMVQIHKRKPSHSLIGAFDAATNWNDLTKSPSINVGMKTLDGLRFLSMIWIILGHTMLHAELNSQDIIADSRQIISGFIVDLPYNATLAVDTFFLLSSFLASYLFLDSYAKVKAAEEASGKKKRQPNIFAWSGLVYFHRYLRLTPLYFVAIMFYTYVLPQVGSGPYWGNFVNSVDADAPCKQYWWTNMLYINNLYPNQFSANAQGGLGCMSWTWYLANDTQLFLILPFLTKLHFYRRKLAWIVLIVLCLIVIGLRAGLTVGYDLQACLGSEGPDAALDQARDQTVVYNKPYTRAIPYLMGIGLAYFYIEKGGAKHTQKLNLSKTTVAAIWTFITGCMLALVFGIYGMWETSGPNTGSCTWNNTQNFFSITFGTTGWSVCITWIVFAALFGYGGWVTKILANDIFCPLSRLVYCAYLVHPMLMYSLDYSGSEQIDWFGYQIMIDFFGLTVMSFMVAVLGHLLIEKPLTNVQKIVLPAGR